MEDKHDRIKVKALAWIEDQGMLFVVKLFDTVKEDAFYRPIGGSVEFGETTLEAVKREVKEEIQTQIEVTGTPMVLENIFVCDGKHGHEINYLYRTNFIDKTFYERKIYRLVEMNGDVADALWISIKDCLNGTLRLVPEQLLDWYQNID